MYWTKGPKLKAATLTCLHAPPAPVGIVAIPIYAVIEPGDSPVTIEEYFYTNGREALTARLEELFGIPIDSYIHVEQSALQEFSDTIGPLRIGDTTTSLTEVFEGTYTGEPVNLEWEIRALAANMLTPGVILKIPRLVWIYSTRIDSDLNVRHVLALHKVIRETGPEILRKQKVPGKDYQIGDKRYRLITPDGWTKTLRAVTARENYLQTVKAAGKQPGGSL